MEVKRTGSVKQGDEVVGSEVLVKVTKNKVAPPFKEARFNIMYGIGISKSGEILDAAIELGIVAKSGAWFSYGDERLGQGRVNVEKMLMENQELFSKIEEEVLETIRPKTADNTISKDDSLKDGSSKNGKTKEEKTKESSKKKIEEDTEEMVIE